MSFLFILCFNVFSNVHIDVNEDTIKLDWYNDRIIYYNGENDHSISDNYLDITIDVTEKFYLYIDILESRQCNLQINLTSQNEISYATIFLNSELETINIFKKLTVYSNVPISFQNPKYIKFFFQSFNKDGLLTNNYFPYDKEDKTMICYMSDKCASLTTIQTNVIYYSFLNKSTPYYEQNNYTENITIYFDNDHSDVPYFFKRSDESNNLIYLIGLKENPSQISFENSDNSAIRFLFIQNIQFTKCHTESLITIYDCYINDTYDVFPSNCKLKISNAYENRKNTNQSPFENNNIHVSDNHYHTYLELEKNGDLIFQFVNKSINILKNKKELIITIPLTESRYWPGLQFDDQKNPNNNTITMDIVDNPGDILFSFLNCDQIPIEFSDNCNFVNSSLDFEFETSNKNDILMKPPNNENISITINAYQHPLEKTYFIYPRTGYTIYTTPDKCEDSSNENKKCIETIDDLYNFLDTYQNISSITLNLNSNYNEKEFDFAPHLYDNFYSLNIYYFDSSNPISITLKSLKDDIYLKITNCNVNISNDFQTNDKIKLYDNSTITNNLQTEAYCNVDIRSDDAILKLYNDFYEIGNFVYNYDTKLVLKANSLNHYLKIEFDANVKEAKINLLTEDSLSYIPIDIKEDYENDETKQVEIELFIENSDIYMPSNVIYKSLPKRTYVFIYYEHTFNDHNIFISKIFPEDIAEGIVFTYTDPYQMRYRENWYPDNSYYFLAKNDDEFEKIMKFAESITGKASMNMRFDCFFESHEIKIKFQYIPKHIQIVYFTKIEFNNDKSYLNLLLADDVDVSSFNGLLFFDDYIKFKVDPNSNKIFEFNEIQVYYPLFNFYDLDKIKVKTASIYLSVTKNGYYRLRDFAYYDLSPFFDKIKTVLLNNDDYNESIYITFENNNVGIGITPQKKNVILPHINELVDKFLFVSNLTNKNNIVFNIADQTINQTNFVIDNESYMVDLNFTCGNDQNSNFMVNLYVNELIENNVTINEGNCNDFIVKNVILYPLIILPTKEFSLSEKFSLSNPFTKSYDFTHSNLFTDNPTEEAIVPTQEYVPPLKVENKNTTSDFIEITNDGYITKEENEDKSEKKFDKDPTSIKTITLLSNEVTISENNNIESTPENTLYLVASSKGTKITIKSSVNKSNVGILSDNSPTIVLEKSRNSVNLMNSGNEKENHITIDVEKNQEDGQEVTELYFKDVENRNGEFSVIVPLNIEIISFMNLIMSRISTFGVKKNKENKRNIHKLDENEEFVNVQIENSINVDSQSLVSISNVNLIGTLNIYDDSSLTMNENSNFSENSEINVVIRQSKSYTFDKPIIYVEHSLNSIPKAIILMSDPNNKKIDISNMPIIASEQFDLCSKLNGLVKFQDGKDGDISTKCENHDNKKILLLSAKEKEGKKNKLGAGAITGIVIGCVAAVAIIAIVVIILIRRKRNNFSNDEDENNSEVSEL